MPDDLSTMVAAMRGRAAAASARWDVESECGALAADVLALLTVVAAAGKLLDACDNQKHIDHAANVLARKLARVGTHR